MWDAGSGGDLGASRLGDNELFDEAMFPVTEVEFGLHLFMGSVAACL
jgi:hypothetical protein